MDYEDLHKEAIVIDSHNDTIVAHIRRGNMSLERGHEGQTGRHSGTIAFLRGYEDPRPGASFIQINFPKMRKGGIDAAFFAIDVTKAFKNRLTYALDGFGYLINDLEQSNANAAIIRRSEDILKCKSNGHIAIVLSVEHADCTERSLNVLRILYEIGVRSIGLTHNVSSWAADGCMEARENVGLTRFGEAIVHEMNKLGILVDLAHLSPSAFYSVLDVTKKPVIFSHGNVKTICNHPRNLSDDQLKALEENGGVIGISYVPDFVDKTSPNLDLLLDHIEYVISIVGVDTVGLGSDFDGGGTLLADATEVPIITKGLINRGYSKDEICKILGGNIYRVLKETIR
jgi:membrane dipeptidase